jgi:hypothetical protein
VLSCVSFTLQLETRVRRKSESAILIFNSDLNSLNLLKGGRKVYKHREYALTTPNWFSKVSTPLPSPSPLGQVEYSESCPLTFPQSRLTVYL